MRPARDTFLDDAASILATAEKASGETGYTLLIRRDGSLHMIAESDWPLDSLAAHHGAQRAYRVTNDGARVSVEGRSGYRKCRLASEPPGEVARGLLGAPALYRLSAPV